MSRVTPAPGPFRRRARARRRRAALALTALAVAVVVLLPGRGRPDEAGGAVPDRTSAFDRTVPGVTRLDPGLLRALRAAAATAAGAGITLHVNSGWRSPAYEERLHREAVARYGSEAEAARWVARGTTSRHVTGDAVDVGPPAAAAWLGEHGRGFGLCRVYDNEPWHFERRPRAPESGCPATYADPTQDPRMQG